MNSYDPSRRRDFLGANGLRDNDGKVGGLRSKCLNSRMDCIVLTRLAVCGDDRRTFQEFLHRLVRAEQYSPFGERISSPPIAP